MLPIISLPHSCMFLGTGPSRPARSTWPLLVRSPTLSFNVPGHWKFVQLIFLDHVGQQFKNSSNTADIIETQPFLYSIHALRSTAGLASTSNLSASLA